MNYRVVYSNDGVLTDLSLDINNLYGGDSSFTFIAAEDYLFLGSPYPFNSIYFKVKTAAVTNVIPSIDYWTGNEWVPSIEAQDETNGFKKSGYITWQINRFKSSWSREDTKHSGGGERVTGLGGVNIYDQYWARLKLSGDAVFALTWVGHCFITDNDLKTEYPEFKSSTLLGAVESGKTTWEEQIIRASRLVIEDLIQRRIITNQSQILDRRKMESMTVSKTAEIIYNLLGDDYTDQRAAANKEYMRRVDGQILSVDLNNDGDLSLAEGRFRQGYLYQ